MKLIVRMSVVALESEDPELEGEKMSQTLQMLMRDLCTTRQLAAVN